MANQAHKTEAIVYKNMCGQKRAGCGCQGPMGPSLHLIYPIEIEDCNFELKNGSGFCFQWLR
jgi:hypothetical protein